MDEKYKEKYKSYKEKYIKLKNDNEQVHLINDQENPYIDLFPDAKNIDKSKLQMTNVGKYSITNSNDSKKVVEFMKKNIPEDLHNLTITESNGGVGGDTIAFAKLFKKVNTVEYLPLHCSVIKNNLSVYNLTNVDIFCDNYAKKFDMLKQDVLYMDPPWGGPGYKKYKKLNLFIDRYHISDIVRKIKAKYVFIKAPYNYNLDKLEGLNYITEKIRNYQLIFIKN